MTGARELVQLQVVSAAPEQVRLSVHGGRTQLDISLPRDAPVADLLPELVRLVRSRDRATSADDPAAKDAERRFWALQRADGTALSPDATLRAAGIGDGTLLRLTSERALPAPTLYDDVVDAAARLNKAAYAGWSPAAARWTAFAAVHLTTAVWAYFLVAAPFQPHRVALAAVATVVALALLGGAALAHRSYGQPLTAAALGWAAIPITAGVVTAATAGRGGYWQAAGCAALIVVFALAYRGVGTGHWGFLAAGVTAVLVGAAAAADQGGLRIDLVGGTLIVLGTLACLTVPRISARWYRYTPPGAPAETDEPLFENPFTGPDPAAPGRGTAPAAATPTAEDVWDRVRAATLTRSALYAGLAAGAVVGAVVLLRSQTPVSWSAFALVSASTAALAMYTHRPATVLERAALGGPAVASAVATAWAAQRGVQPMPLVAFALLLAAVAALALVGGAAARTRRPAWLPAALTYLEYLMSASLIPLALWVAGVYARLVG